MPHAETRHLAAIMFTDMVGFSRQLGADEARTLRLLALHNQVIKQTVASHQGHVIKTAGDGFLIEFPSVVHAVHCAQAIQAHFYRHNLEKEKNDQIHVRIGLHEGDILVQPNGDVLGDGVNINGITEVLTSDLSRISSLFVIARNTAFTFKKPVNVQEVGREPGVRYVLEGSVQKAGDQVRIVAQLIDTTTGGHLWSQRYDRPLKDIFALQDDIVQKIVTTLKLQLSAREQGVIVRKRTDNPEAYDTFLRGADYFYR